MRQTGASRPQTPFLCRGTLSPQTSGEVGFPCGTAIDRKQVFAPTLLSADTLSALTERPTGRFRDIRREEKPVMGKKFISQGQSPERATGEATSSSLADSQPLPHLRAGAQISNQTDPSPGLFSVITFSTPPNAAPGL